MTRTGIDPQAVANHGRPIAFGDMIAFDQGRREAAGRKAWRLYCAASHSPYGMESGIKTAEWARIQQVLSDENPHYQPEAKAEAIRTVERVTA